MKPMTFPEIRDLLNEVSLARFDAKPFFDAPNLLAVHEGAYFLTNGDEFPASVVYIYSGASAKGLRSEIRNIKIQAHTEVVYSPSAEAAALSIDWRANGARKVVSSKEYLVAFMRSELGKYRSELRKLQHKDLEKPSVATPSGFKARIPNPLELFLGESSEQEEDGQIAVLLAEAGHGKTYLSEWVAGRLAESDERVLPIFVSAKQWTGLMTPGGAALEAIICNSFRAFGCPIRWVDGRERAFLRVALKLGIFRLIFDGFDEFALQASRHTSVREVLSSLVTLTQDTGARVLVTARTSFWDSQVSAEAADLQESLDIYVLQPFDIPKATNYFKRKLGSDVKAVESAAEVFRQLHAANPALAGRGVVLRLVADLAEKSGTLAPIGSTEPISWLMYSLCRRDQERQKLPLGPDAQLTAMREFVLMKFADVEPTDETFGLAIQVAAEIDDAAVGDVLTRFSSHALIRRTAAGLWEFVNPQIELTLLGQLIIEASLHQAKRGELELSRMNAGARLRPDQEVDLAYVVLSLMDFEPLPTAYDERCQQVFGMLTRASPLSQSNTFAYSLFRRLATYIILRSKNIVRAKDKSDRTSALLAATGSSEIDGLHITGALNSFDFQGKIFRRCLFQDVTFGGCKFDEGTIFVGCRFEGGDANRCEGLGRAIFQDCTYSASGHEFVRSEQVREGTKKYGDDDLSRDLRALVDKFVRQAGATLKTVHKDDLIKGKISTSPNMKEVVGAFEKFILETARHSGDPVGGYAVKADARESVLFFYQNNSLVGPMANAADQLRSRLGVQ